MLELRIGSKAVMDFAHHACRPWGSRGPRQKRILVAYYGMVFGQSFIGFIRRIRDIGDDENGRFGFKPPDHIGAHTTMVHRQTTEEGEKS